MDPPATEQGRSAASEWLIDAAVLDGEALARVNDPQRPDRLAWNTLRTLALWERDAWVPPLLEIACGRGNPLSPLEWAGTSVVPWVAGGTMPDVAEVALDGPDAYVLLACTLLSDPAEAQLRAAAMAALEPAMRGGREAGVVVVAPPGSDDVLARLEGATRFALDDRHLARDRLTLGWVSWPELGRLALDLAEESDPAPREQVRRLIEELQGRFPDAKW